MNKEPTMKPPTPPVRTQPVAKQAKSLSQVADEHQQKTLEQLRKRAAEDPTYEVKY